MLEGPKGTFLQLVLRVPGGEPRGISVTRSVSLTDRWPLQRPAVEIDSLPDGVVVVRLNNLDSREVVEQFDKAFPLFTGVRGLILDLRGTASGEPTYGYQILARLTVAPFPTVWRRTPDYRPGLRLLGLPDSAASWYTLPMDTIAPRRDRPAYTGRIAVLSSPATAGAAEDFLAAFRNTARGVIIGATSAGSPGRPLELPLLKDWSLRLSVVQEAFPDGADFVGTGIAPELPVLQTVNDWLAGRDAVVERARAYLAAPRH
jgi:C-terminal processing protease CtpA/Prc